MDLDWPWLSCIRYVCGAKCLLCFFMHAYLTLVLWGGLFIFAKAHMWCADPVLCLHTACVTRVCATILFCACTYECLCAQVHVGCMPCTKMDLRPAVKVSEFKQAPPSGSCSTDSYKQDLRKCCAVLPCMANRQPGLKNISPCATHITHRLAATPAPLPWQSFPQTITTVS